jgi:hypothetical protein
MPDWAPPAFFEDVRFPPYHEVAQNPPDPVEIQARRSAALQTAREVLLPQRGPLGAGGAPKADDLIAVATWILTGEHFEDDEEEDSPAVQAWRNVGPNQEALARAWDQGYSQRPLFRSGFAPNRPVQNPYRLAVGGPIYWGGDRHYDFYHTGAAMASMQASGPEQPSDYTTTEPDMGE